MPVNLVLPEAVSVPGVKASTCAAGIKSNGTDDMVLFVLEPGSVTAGVFTQNTFCAAPVTVAKQHVSSQVGQIRGLLINSGNANAGTGHDGITVAREHCAAVADALGCEMEAVLPYSTGVIGQPLPNQLMKDHIPQLVDTAVESTAAMQQAARGIMTTDTVPKISSAQFMAGDQAVTITGMSKGAGMIEPNMATMLAYVFTDAVIAEKDLNTALKTAVDLSFNAITVDSDTSTNDACMLCATGVGATLAPGSEHWDEFQQNLNELMLLLAQAIIRDAEGATKFITVTVEDGACQADCRKVGYAIANSPLVKTAMFASDANVGRLLMAIGKVGLPGLDPYQVTVNINNLPVFNEGRLHPDYTEERGSDVMQATDITVTVNLGMGDERMSVYTSDLSHDYVTINAEYRT